MSRRATQKSNGKLWLAILVSALGHALVATLIILFDFSPPAIDLDNAAVKVKLVKLGEKEDETLLPRLESDMQPPPVEKVLEKAPEPKPEPKYVPVAKAVELKPKKKVEKKVESALDILNKRFGKPDDHGKKTGSALGDALKNDLAMTYEMQVGALIQQSYSLPSVLTIEERKKLTVFVRIKVNSQGKATDIRITKASGQAIFDNAVLAGAKSIQSFGPPPLTLRQTYANDGIKLQFCPISCDAG